MKKRRTLILLVCCFAIIGLLTGCGKENNKPKLNSEYEEYINAIRNATFGDYTLGELYDNALNNSSWDKYTKMIPSGSRWILISVKGTNKFSEDETIEVVYEVNMENLEYNFKTMIVNGEKDGNLISLMQKSAEDLDNNK